MIQSKSQIHYQIIINIILALVSIMMIVPLIIMFSSSFSSDQALISRGYFIIPRDFRLDAYLYIWQNRATVFRAYAMTIITTAVGLTINMFLCTTLAYALSLEKLPFKKIISFYVIFTMLFNGGLVPQYIMWTTVFQLKNTFWALIVPNMLLNVMNVIIIRSYMQTSVPTALYEAAEIDGAGKIKVFFQIALPLSKPILVAMGLFTGLGFWNDWTNGLYYVNKQKLYTVQLLLNKMLQDLQALQSNASASSSGLAMKLPQVSIRMAIAVVGVLPILILYPFLEKYFAEGITIGAVKG